MVRRVCSRRDWVQGARARVLPCQRAGGATLDTFTVRRDGSARLEKRYGGRTFTAREGGVVPAARPAVRILDGFIDGVGVRKVTRESATHAP